MNEEAIKHAFDLFASDGYTGNYDQFKQLIQSNPEAKTHAFGLFASDGYTGSEVDFDQLIGGGASEPVKKKEESVPLWLQKQEQQQPKPKQEQTPPFLESKPSGISLGSQRVPETAPMFEAPPMRTAEEARAIVESPEDQSKIADSEQGWLLNTVSSLDRGFYKNLIGNPVKGMGTLLEGATAKVFGGTGKGPISDALINFGNYYNNAIDELTPQDEEFKNTLTDQFGQAFGQVASLILTGGVAGAGKEGAALATTAPTGIVGTASAAGKQLASTLTSPTAISGGLSMGQAEFDRAKEAGATDEQAYEVFFKNAAVGSVLEQIPVMQFLKRFNQSTAGGVANYIKTKGVAGLTGGFEEMTTEVLQQLYSNKTAQEIYNINQQLLEGVGESGGVGFGVGFILNAMGAKVKKLKKEGNTAEAQLIENQIENFESKPKGPTPSYSVNGIKIESPEVINQMIDNMDATDLANSNIEITNDPELSVKMQDKMVTSSIKEEVRSANPDIDEDTLDQITALEKERKKFEGKKTQSAKDKLASINSQIKILQENAVQKPSTEEGVLRPEESQVGLQEVGEGDAKAPTEEVAKEEVATTEDFPEVEAVETVDVSSGFEDYNPDSLTIGEDVHYSFNGKSYSKGKVVGRPSASKPNVYTVRNENGVPTVIIYGGERTNVTLKKPTLEQPKEIVATPEEDLQAALDRIEIPEDTEAVPPATPVVEAAPKVSLKTQKAKTPKAKSVPIPVSIPKPAPAPAPAPKPVAVVSQPAPRVQGPEALQEEYKAKILEVTLNKDKSRTAKQIEERKKELVEEYKKLKAEMTAPRPKAEPEAKAAPKVEAKPTPKKAEPAPKAEPVVSKKDQAEIKRLQDEIDYYQGQIENATEELGNTNYNYEEIEAEVEKKKDELEGKKMSEQKREDAIEELDAKLEEAETERDTYLEQYDSELKEALREKKKAEKKLAKLQSKQVETKAEPTSVVEEEEPSYDDIKDLDPTDETALEKVLRKLDSGDASLKQFGRGNLSSGMAIPLARAIIKALKVLVKTGITLQEAIKQYSAKNNLEEKDIVKMIKDIDNAQSAMKKLKDQIKAEARSATDAKNDMNQKRKNLSKVISEIEASGKISAFKAKAVINKINKLNLDSKVAVDKFIDYVGKIFTDAEYANKLNISKALRSDIRKLSKKKEKFANLRDLGSKFASIDPSMVEDIDEYNEMAILIRDSISGSTTRKADVKFTNMIKESDAMSYINKAMEAQQKVLLSQKQEEVQELLDIDASDLTYDQLMELVNDDKPLTKYNEGLIRAAINKAFKLYSSMIDASMRNGKDVFTDEDVPYTTNQKKIVKEFMSMDLNVLSPKQALESVDALMNFLQSQSIAKMESVLAKYKGETEMRAIEKKGIKAKPVRKYWSKGLGRLLLEQTANLPIVFERMFGGFTKGGMVEDAMGITALKNGKSKAQSESNNIVNRYVDKFYKLKPNGEVFNTAFNNIERGMVAFMSRNVFGTDSEMKVEFKRRRDLIEESIAELEKGNEQEVAKAKVYQEVYDKVLKDSDSIEQVQGKAAPENLEAVKFWQEEWSDKYEQLYDTALGVYNKILEKDMNYSMPDRYSKLSSDTGEVDITTEDMGFLINSGTAPLYKKETGVLMAATRPESLPKSKGTSKTNRYIDLSFDNTNSNAMYDALVDINTAAPIRQVQSALNSDAFARIMKGTGDEKLIKNRIDLYVRNIRNKNPFSNDEFSKAVKNLNRLASVGVGQALGGVLQPIKQVAPIAMNTLINAGGLDVQSTFDLAKQRFMDESGYAIGNRGVESQAQIESLNKMIEEAAKSKPEQAIKAIEKINNWWLKSFLVKPDVYIARASWMTYYEQSLKKQGVNPAGIDYNTHEINETAANYAQRQVDRQQNVSDSDLAGALLSDKDASKQLFVKVLMPFASFRMNQSARLGSDLSTIMDKTATKEDKEIATRSIGGFAVEMAVFRAVSAASALLIAAAVKGVMGRDDDEEKDKKKNDAIVKGQLTSTVADVFSPTPLLDKGIQLGASAVLDATQDALDISEEEKLEIYSGNKQDFFQSLGLLGISGARASQLYEMSVLAAGGSYEDDYGRKKYLSEKDRDAIATLIPIAIVSNIGLAPSEVNSIVRSSLSDAKRSGTTVESEQSKSKSEESKIMGLNKGDLKRYYPDIYERYYGEGTPDAERRKLEQEQSAIEQKTKDEYYNYVPEKKKKGGINRQGINRGGINRGSTGSE